MTKTMRIVFKKLCSLLHEGAYDGGACLLEGIIFPPPVTDGEWGTEGNKSGFLVRV